jgi:hypothetical protein
MQRVRIGIVLMIAFTALSARQHVVEPNTQNSFYQKVQERPFAIVLFYLEDKADKQWTQEVKYAMHEFKAASESSYYRNVGLRFLAINIGKKKINDLEKEYGIQEVPAYVLFKAGNPVKDENQKIILLSGAASREDLKTFIKENLQGDLEEQLRINYERRQDLENMYRGSAYFGTYYPYNYWGPYDPYYPYYYGSYGYPYGYYGNYYAPGAGFGFSVSF